MAVLAHLHILPVLLLLGGTQAGLLGAGPYKWKCCSAEGSRNQLVLNNTSSLGGRERTQFVIISFVKDIH